MAQIRRCKYCHRNVLNRDSHSECRLVYCEDLLSQVQKHLKENGNAALSAKLAKQIKEELFTTRESFEEAKRKKENAEREGELWEIAKNRAMDDFLQDWEKKNPDPNPRRYA